jgi:uncharacterized membrane protein
MFREWVDLAAQGLDSLAVVIMVVFIAVGTALGLIQFAKNSSGTYARFRAVLGRTLQIGLELLVAADIVRTVSTPLTITNLLLLSGLVVVRTFLGWTLTVEIEGHWPWQTAKESTLASARANPDDTEAGRTARSHSWTTY